MAATDTPPPVQCQTPSLQQTIENTKIFLRKSLTNESNSDVSPRSIKDILFHNQKYVRILSEQIPRRIYKNLKGVVSLNSSILSSSSSSTASKSIVSNSTKDFNLTFLPMSSANSMIFFDSFVDAHDPEETKMKIIKVSTSPEDDYLHTEVIVNIALRNFLLSNVKCSKLAQQFMYIENFFTVPLYKYKQEDKDEEFQIQTYQIYTVMDDKSISAPHFPCIMFEAQENESLASIITFHNLPNYHDGPPPMDINRLMFKLNVFFTSFIYISKQTGFYHNDMHMRNIIYNKQKNVFMLIDYGRAYIGNATCEPIMDRIYDVYHEYSRCKIYQDANQTNTLPMLNNHTKYRKLFNEKTIKKRLLSVGHGYEERVVNAVNLNAAWADIAGLAASIMKTATNTSNSSNYIVDYYNAKLREYNNSKNDGEKLDGFVVPLGIKKKDGKIKIEIRGNIKELQTINEIAKILNNGRVDFFIKALTWMSLFIYKFMFIHAKHQIRERKSFAINIDKVFGNSTSSILWISGILWPDHYNSIVNKGNNDILGELNGVFDEDIQNGGALHELKMLEQQIEEASKFDLRLPKYKHKSKSPKSLKATNMKGGEANQIAKPWIEADAYQLPRNIPCATENLNINIVDNDIEDISPLLNVAPPSPPNASGGQQRKSNKTATIQAWTDIYKDKDQWSLPKNPQTQKKHIILKEDPKKTAYKIYVEAATSKRYIKKNKQIYFLEQIRGRYNYV